MKKFNKLFLSVLLVFVMMFTFVSCSGGSNDDTIRITHKNYTEQRLMGQVMSVYLQSKGFKTTISELGATMLCLEALKNDQVDLYAEYTGTAYSAVLNQTEILSPEETYDFVKKEFEEQFNLTWLDEFGYNNTYVLAVTRETAEEYNLKTISDLIPISSEFLLGCDNEFGARIDGLPGMMETYEGLEFKAVKNMDQGLTYQAVASGELDANASYSTDGRIAKLDLVMLEDDLDFFPPYYLVPILGEELAESNPELVAALKELGGKFTEQDMQKYNLMVDEGQNPMDVATNMLKDKGLID